MEKQKLPESPEELKKVVANERQQHQKFQAALAKARSMLDRDAIKKTAQEIAKTFKVESVSKALMFSINNSRYFQKVRNRIVENINKAQKKRDSLLEEVKSFLPENTPKSVRDKLKPEIQRELTRNSTGESIALLLEQVNGRLPEEEVKDMALAEREEHYRNVSKKSFGVKDNQKIYFFVPRDKEKGHGLSHVLLESYEDMEGNLAIRPVWIMGSLSWVQTGIQDLRVGVQFEEMQKAMKGQRPGKIAFSPGYISNPDDFQSAVKHWRILLGAIARASRFNDGKLGINGKPPKKEKEKQEQSESEPDVTPAAEELAQENDIDLLQVKGSGKDGRITKKDVKEAIGSQ